MAKILVIDDDSQMRNILSQTVMLSGHEVVVASNGEEGLEMFNEAPAAVVITDIFMPHMSGVKLIKKIRENDSQVKIIAISGAGGGAFDTHSVLEHGANKYLEKPFMPDELIAAINGMLNDQTDDDG